MKHIFYFFMEGGKWVDGSPEFLTPWSGLGSDNLNYSLKNTNSLTYWKTQITYSMKSNAICLKLRFCEACIIDSFSL